MSRNSLALLIATAGAAAWSAAVCAGDPLEWTTGLRAGDFDGSVFALSHIPGDGGTSIVAGGDFTQAGGRVHAEFVARWDGATWAPLGVGPPGPVYALAVHDDGAGPRLYAGGSVDDANRGYIARWEGDRWCTVGLTDPIAIVFALASYRGALFAGGTFLQVEQTPAPCIARWTGGIWLPVGDTRACAKITSLRVLDHGSGPGLFATGSFELMGGYPMANLGRWDERGWTAVGPPWFERTTYAIDSLDDGERRALVAGGFGAPAMLDLDTGEWTGLDAPPGLWWIRDLGVADLGDGPTLFAVGAGDEGIARWNGTAWESVMGGLAASAVTLLAAGDGGGLYVGGPFRSAGGDPAGGIAWLDDRGWSPVGSDDPHGLGADDDVYAMHVFAREANDDAMLYVGGRFTHLGGQPSAGLAAWDGRQWHDVGVGGTARVIIDHDDGDGPRVFVGVSSPGLLVARRGDGWEPILFPDIGVSALAEHDDGTGRALYVGGGFTTVDGRAVRRILRWTRDGWSEVGGGFDQQVRALATYDDGTGTALYAIGSFSEAGGRAVRGLARWDGATWSEVGGGIETRYTFPSLRALHVHDDGAGPALFVGGDLVSAGGVPVSGIARWNGRDWSDLDGGVGSTHALGTIVGEDGRATLWASPPGPAFLRWDGVRWQEVAGPLRPVVADAYVIRQFVDGDVFVGGSFQRAGRVSSWNIARRGLHTCRADLDDSGAVDHADLAALLAYWGPCSTCPEDVDENGRVDTDDVLFLLRDWGSCDVAP